MPTLHVSRRSYAGIVLQASAWVIIFSGVRADEATDSTPESASQAQAAPAAVNVRAEQVPNEEPSATKPTTGERLAKHIIGATAIIFEPQSQLSFLARVDTGAASCSIHCEQWEIEDEAKTMEANIGKPIRILLGNHRGEPEWIESQIDHCVTVKTSERKENRYKVPLTFRWKNIEKQVFVTLNNRSHMNYPVLLGRNFLEGDFLVDIEEREQDRAGELAKSK